MRIIFLELGIGHSSGKREGVGAQIRLSRGYNELTRSGEGAINFFQEN